MQIQPTNISQSGSGVEMSVAPEGFGIEMSDPVRDLGYTRNEATLTYGLADYEHIRLRFSAREFGDEPHEPPAGAFGDDVDFDGVAVSVDGANWYEIQDLRHLRSDRFTAFDIDLDAALLALGLSYNGSFRVRFCQYDNNPAPMDGFTITGIALEGDLRPAVLHLTLNDNGATATVADTGSGAHDQTFLDAGGNPATSAHTAAGRVGTALLFDGVDDRIVLSADSHKAVLGANRDFSIAFWWKTNGPNPAGSLHVLSNYSDTEHGMYVITSSGNFSARVHFVTTPVRDVVQGWPGGADGQWHHYVIMRKGTVLSFYRDGVLGQANTHADNALALAPAAVNLTIGGRESGNQMSPGWCDDFRLYDRALSDAEIAELITN